MRLRFKPWQLAALLIVACAGAVLLVNWRYRGRNLSAADLVSYLPPDQAAHIYVDVGSLRSSGLLELLAGSKASEEREYRRFVEQTGFDYRSDLDALALAWARAGVYVVARGRFDWKLLYQYAPAQGGECRAGVCTMPGESKEHNISFSPVRSGVMAFAVSKQARGVDAIGPRHWPSPPRLPAEPVWISIPAFMFNDADALPEAAHSLLAPLAQAQEVTFAVGPKDQRLEVRLEVVCTTPEAARSLATELTKTTGALKEMLTRDHPTPDPSGLSSMLADGRFEHQDRTVSGGWPMQRAFLEALASGRVQ